MTASSAAPATSHHDADGPPALQPNVSSTASNEDGSLALPAPGSQGIHSMAAIVVRGRGISGTFTVPRQRTVVFR